MADRFPESAPVTKLIPVLAYATASSNAVRIEEGEHHQNGIIGDEAIYDTIRRLSSSFVFVL